MSDPEGVPQPVMPPPVSRPVTYAGGEMAGRVRTTDWSRTPLGPMERWPASLRLALGICLNSRFPMFVWWGPDLIKIYNDAYAPMLGKRHPDALGRPAQAVWGDIWDVVGPQAEAVMQRGESTWNERVLLVMERNGFPEDTWFTWSYSPIPNESGGIGGLFCACTEETPRVLAEEAAREAERRYRGVFEAGRDALIVYTPDGVVVEVNPAACRMYGYAYEQMIGVDATRAVHPDARPMFQDFLRAAGGGGEYRCETVDRRRDGATFPIEVVGTSFTYNGRPHLMAVIRDITERRRAVDRISRLHGVAAALSEALTVGDVARVTVEQGIAALGATAGSLALLAGDATGLEMAGSVGYPPEVIEKWQRFPLDAPIPLADAVRRGEPIYLETSDERLRRYPALAAVTPIRSTQASACIPLIVGGGAVGVLGLSFDNACGFPVEDRAFMLSFTRQCAQALERARLFEAERRARAEAERASSAKDEFLAVLSHELRTPLTPVMLTVSLMEQHPGLPDDLREDVATIRRNVELESRLISDLLDLTRIARGKLQLDAQDVDLHLVVRSAVAICQREASARLVLDLSATHHMVRGDGTRLQQIFWNLVNNAIKFTGPDGTITVRSTDAEPGRMRVEVIDTGAGIEPEVLPRLFNAFEQGDARPGRQQAGLGLGLAISRRLAEAHGGTITAASEGRDRGATFTVELPVAVDESMPVPATPRPVRSKTRTRSVAVLLVEDHEPTLRVMTKLLTLLGHRVTGATSVASAVAAAGQGRFDVIISDLGLPDGSGLDVMRRLRDQYPGRAIALTGYGMDSDIAASADAGFAEHLTKPVDLTSLEAAIHRIAAASAGSE